MAASGARLIPMAFAGFGGAAVFQNSEKALEYVGELLRLVLGRVDRLGGAGGGGGGDAALLERLNSLASKVDVALLNARAAPSPTVVVRDGGSSGAGARETSSSEPGTLMVTAVPSQWIVGMWLAALPAKGPSLAAEKTPSASHFASLTCAREGTVGRAGDGSVGRGCRVRRSSTWARRRRPSAAG